jgi:hypothetical protein
MRKCTIEECQAEQCAPNNPYLCVRRTNGVIDGANSSCYIYYLQIPSRGQGFPPGHLASG